ncbi:hypothetical protein KAFR_0C01640 [Kazachstania africana CBS 2517]|uniref:PCI domain-containing protein n=1 Tax=Kazachstania africana (strain ATCC 22294 / BCRC 22015 / CBS 2517 / CECT 1963 / NBRC 1671 / NRRL Y-8276) TaxID=1071382 RepID=H2AS07_KAZAF|nr:hypothetical protein KAFR_0C01640 [Kazachstania africana CBS 2517]CCF57157.1 hypothetical protein KAFR_0C01640 [Kazachstania africana CBS 2517]
MDYPTFNVTSITTISSDIQRLHTCLRSLDLPKTDLNHVISILNSLIDKMLPFSSLTYMFEIEPNERLKLQRKIGLYLLLATQFDWLLQDEVSYLSNLQNLLQSRMYQLKIFEIYIKKDVVDEENYKALQEEFHTLKKDNNAENSSTTYKLCNKIMLDEVSVLLQCCIIEFLNTGAISDKTNFRIYIEWLESTINCSLALQQQSKLILLLNFGVAILHIVLEEDDDDDEDDYDIENGSVDLINHTERFRLCCNSLLKCLKSLEEIGGRNKGHSFERLPLFYEVILTGYVLTSMILISVDRDNINPFGYEQMKILNDQPIMLQLKGIYQNFIDLNLQDLYHSIQKISKVTDILSGIVNRIYHICQSLKLWTKIAPIYSSISINDIRSKLQVNPSLKVSRDDVLKLLMVSIMKDKAAVYFKIDFTKDIVLFGDEYKAPLSLYPKEVFNLEPNLSPTSEKGEKSLNDTECLTNLEYAADINLFTTRYRLRNLESNEFFDQLKCIRENAHSDDSSEFPTLKKQTKIAEIISLTQLNLVVMKGKNGRT